jgi:hypothetical protein
MGLGTKTLLGTPWLPGENDVHRGEHRTEVHCSKRGNRPPLTLTLALNRLAVPVLSLLMIGSACGAVDAAPQMDRLQRVPDQLDNNGKRLKARHFDPSSTFVLPFPHEIMPTDPVPNWCYANSQEEYDATPVGMWMIDSHGNGAIKRDSLPAPPTGPCPEVVTQEDYDALPVGTTYRCRGTLFLKHAPAPTPTPTPVAQQRDVSTRNDGQRGRDRGHSSPFPIGGVLAFLVAGLLLFAARRLIGIKRKAVPQAGPSGPSNGKGQPVKVVSRSQACQILGISANATLAEAKTAYRALVRQYHPDFATRLGPELKKEAHIKTTEFNAAMAFIAHEG